MICLLSTNEQGAGGELEVDCRCFFFAATALVLRDRSFFRGGDRDGDRRLFLDRDGDRLFLDRDDDRSLFLDTVTTAVFLERSRDGINFLLREIALLVAATAVASMDLMAATACLSERSTFCFCCFALATCVFLLCDGLSVS